MESTGWRCSPTPPSPGQTSRDPGWGREEITTVHHAGVAPEKMNIFPRSGVALPNAVLRLRIGY